MPELRRDPVLQRWVIMAAERATRPNDYGTTIRKKQTSAACPFCKGNEDKTPEEVYAVRAKGKKANGPGWSVRVVPNKYPALRVEGNLDKRAAGIYDRAGGVGAHEVIIERPDHATTSTDLSDAAMAEVIWAYRARLIDLARDARFSHGIIFKNVGQTAGATVEHSHSQLIATSVLPQTIMREIDGARRWCDTHERNIFSDIIDQELGDEKRVVMDTDQFLAFCPYASRFPFETWIVPKFGGCCFEYIDRSQADAMAAVLQNVLRRIEATLPGVHYNYILHSGPFRTEEMPWYTWHVEIIPHITRVAGFEWGTGMYINPTLPEDAAEFLRSVELPQAKQRRKKKQG